MLSSDPSQSAFLEFNRMYGSSVARHLRVEVRHRNAAPNRYSWEIFSGDRTLPVEESTHQFRSWEDASQFGKKALQQLSAIRSPDAVPISESARSDKPAATPSGRSVFAIVVALDQ